MEFDLKTLISKLPRIWRGLIGAISVHHNHLLSAELWMNDTFHSGYGEILDWNILVECLSEKEPVVQSGDLKL